MAQSEPRPPKGNRSNNPNGDPNFNWRGFVLFALAIMLIGGAFLVKGGPMGNVKEVPYPDFLERLENNLIVREKGLDLVAVQGSATDFIKGWQRTSANPGAPIEPFKTEVNLQLNRNLEEELRKYNVVLNPKSDNNFVASALFSFLPIMLFLLILY